jgi:hypothetical protein
MKDGVCNCSMPVSANTYVPPLKIPCVNTVSNVEAVTIRGDEVVHVNKPIYDPRAGKQRRWQRR